MPLFAPPVTDERTALLAFLEQQRQALRASVWGLSDADAGTTPAASGNSLGGLIKHVTRTERRWVQVSLARPAPSGAVADHRLGRRLHVRTWRLIAGAA